MNYTKGKGAVLIVILLLLFRPNIEDLGKDSYALT